MVLFGVTLWFCFWGCVLIVVCLATLVVVVVVRFRGFDLVAVCVGWFSFVVSVIYDFVCGF